MGISSMEDREQYCLLLVEVFSFPPPRFVDVLARLMQFVHFVHCCTNCSIDWQTILEKKKTILRLPNYLDHKSFIDNIFSLLLFDKCSDRNDFYGMPDLFK